MRQNQPKLDCRHLIFVDETGVTTNMVRRCGRSPKGCRLVCKVPHGHWRMTTFIAGLRHDKITAPMTLDGPMNGEMFKAWVENFLAPVLKRRDIVFMDNLPCHKSPVIREIIEARGAFLRYLPAYSPDLNPIEQSLPRT